MRHGRLAGTTRVPADTDPWPALEALRATGEVVLPGVAPAASAEESECLLRWLDGHGTRLVLLDGTWASPARGAGGSRIASRPLAMPSSGGDGDARAFARPFGRHATTVTP